MEALKETMILNELAAEYGDIPTRYSHGRRDSFSARQRRSATNQRTARSLRSFVRNVIDWCIKSVNRQSISSTKKNEKVEPAVWRKMVERHGELSLPR